MKQAELKALLVGKTIADVELVVDESMSAFVTHGFIFEDGSKVVFGGEHDVVWIDYILDAEGEYITACPEEYEEDEPDPLPTVPTTLQDLLSPEQVEVLRAQVSVFDAEGLLGGDWISTHIGDPWPAADPVARDVALWFEVKYGLNGFSQEPNHVLVGFGPSRWSKGATSLFMATKFHDEWSKLPTRSP